MILKGFHGGLVYVGVVALVGFLGLVARAEVGPLTQARIRYEANHPYYNLSTHRELFQYSAVRTPMGMNGRGQPLRAPKLFTFFLNGDLGVGPTQYSSREALGSSMPLRIPSGPFAPAHAPVRSVEFEPDPTEDK